MSAPVYIRNDEPKNFEALRLLRGLEDLKIEYDIEYYPDDDLWLLYFKNGKNKSCVMIFKTAGMQSPLHIVSTRFVKTNKIWVSGDEALILVKNCYCEE